MKQQKYIIKIETPEFTQYIDLAVGRTYRRSNAREYASYRRAEDARDLFIRAYKIAPHYISVEPI